MKLSHQVYLFLINEKSPEYCVFGTANIRTIPIRDLHYDIMYNYNKSTNEKPIKKPINAIQTN